MLSKPYFAWTAVVLLAILPACTDQEKACTLAEAHTREISLDYGKAFVAEAAVCKGAPQNVRFAWSLNKQLVSEEPQYRFLACPRYRATEQSLVVDLAAGAETVRQTWKIQVRDVKPQYPACGPTLTARDALHSIRSGDLQGRKTGLDFKTAMSCLDQVLEVYPCDVEIAFWAAYADLFLFLQQGPARILLSAQSEDSLSALVDLAIDPLIARYDLLAAEMPEDFSAIADNFDFRPVGLNILIHPGGVWDRGDVLALDGILHLAKGGLKFTSAYVGSIHFIRLVFEFGLLNADRVQPLELPLSFQHELIDELDATPRFLTLYEGGDGEARLAAARQSLITGLTRLEAAVARVKSETTDQREHIFRYYDCGQDGICPPNQSLNPITGDPGEPLVLDKAGDGRYDPATDVYVDRNQNGRYDPAWKVTGPDAGENDLRYSNGETMGTDIFVTNLGRIGFAIPELAQEFMLDIAANLRGPDALDLAKYLKLNQSQLLQLTILSGLNIPELRLSRWFEAPRHPRDFLPLWSHSNRVFWVDREEEPWDDWGYDHLPNALEETVRCPERVSPTGVNLNAIDPSGDNYLPNSNPNDNCDNDENGLVDTTDGRGNSTDYGTEGNGILDFRDKNGNNRHDGCPDPGNEPACEVSEQWHDTGLWTGGKLLSGTITKNNGKWDAQDFAHLWPKGDDVGGRKVAIERDPRNGTLQDAPQPLIDPTYYFFPDARFHGVIVFANPTVNVDGETLTHNAELMRFFSKFIETDRSQRRSR